jgi:GT2 family glycosyltransferase
MPEEPVSIVIPAYNAASTIAQTLEAITRQTSPVSCEVIVVDDGSTDETPQILKDFSGIYLRQTNAGPAAARNRGARLAQHELIYFLDSDCVPCPDWLEKILSGFDDPSIGVVAGGYAIANEQELLARCIHREILYRYGRMPEFPRFFGSYNFCVRRDVFEKTGGFDENYRHPSGEDNALSYKILNAGHRIRFVPGAKVKHYHTDKVKKYLREQFRHGFWRARIYLTHPRYARGDDYTFWKDIIEPPLVAGILVLALLRPPWSLVGLAFLVCLEFGYGLLMVKNAKEGLFWGAVMILRAFWRTFGFFAGLCNLKNSSKAQKSN